jgi:glycosyltransferase involved in cell wall biosynthesis
VLYLGKLTPRKRLDTLVEAFAGLPARRARLVIAGNDMGYGRTLQNLIERFGIRERTILTGLLTGRERLDALADADVVAYASELEVFGIVAVEALLCATPVVVAGDSGCGEVVTEVGGGLVVPPGDPVQLRAGIETILADLTAWRLKAADARERCERYSSDRVAAALETTYARVLASTRAPRLRAAV